MCIVDSLMLIAIRHIIRLFVALSYLVIFD